MKVTRVDQEIEPSFDPIVIEITIESKEEHKHFRKLFGNTVSTPRAIYSDYELGRELTGLMVKIYDEIGVVK